MLSAEASIPLLGVLMLARGTLYQHLYMTILCLGKVYEPTREMPSSFEQQTLVVR